MNDMRDLENGFKREPLGVGVGDVLPEREVLRKYEIDTPCRVVRYPNPGRDGYEAFVVDACDRLLGGFWYLQDAVEYVERLNP